MPSGNVSPVVGHGVLKHEKGVVDLQVQARMVTAEHALHEPGQKCTEARPGQWCSSASLGSSEERVILPLQARRKEAPLIFVHRDEPEGVREVKDAKEHSI